MSFELQGHRGCRGLRPENTLPGFAAAVQLGVASIETDIQRTRDGVLVLYHDFAICETICRRVDDRVPDPAQRPLIADLTFEQLQGYAADGNPDPQRFPTQAALADPRWGSHPWRIPTLAELLAFPEPVIFDLEIKRRPFRGGSDGIEEQVVAAIHAAGVAQRSRVRSFDHRVVRRVKEVDPALETAILITGTTPIDPAALARQAGASIYCTDFEFLDLDVLHRCHDAGVRVIPWTVNETADMATLLDWGIDGITTDYPDRTQESRKLAS